MGAVVKQFSSLIPYGLDGGDLGRGEEVQVQREPVPNECELVQASVANTESEMECPCGLPSPFYIHSRLA